MTTISFTPLTLGLSPVKTGGKFNTGGHYSWFRCREREIDDIVNLWEKQKPWIQGPPPHPPTSLFVLRTFYYCFSLLATPLDYSLPRCGYPALQFYAGFVLLEYVSICIIQQTVIITTGLGSCCLSIFSSTCCFYRPTLGLTNKNVLLYLSFGNISYNKCQIVFTPWLPGLLSVKSC